jgi:hypothetical protein
MFLGLFIGVFGTLLGIRLYQWTNAFLIRRRWESAGEYWTDLLNRIEGTVQYYRQRGPDPEFVAEVRRDLDEMGDMRISEQEQSERRERIAGLERAYGDAKILWNHEL